MYLEIFKNILKFQIEPEKLQIHEKNQWDLFLQKIEQICPYFGENWVFSEKIFLPHKIFSILSIFLGCFSEIIIFSDDHRDFRNFFEIFTMKMAFLDPKIQPETRPEPDVCYPNPTRTRKKNQKPDPNPKNFLKPEPDPNPTFVNPTHHYFDDK